MRLSAKDISFKYSDEKYILKNINIQVESGEVVGITAPSGFGKTTLAKILAGYQKPECGQIILEGMDFIQRGYHPVQLIFQHPEKSINPKWKMRKVLSESELPSEKLMLSMGIQIAWLDRWPSELSGGELQRFCVLRALSEKTKFIIADEMTTMLDTITQTQIWKIVLDYAKLHRIGVVVISHDQALMERICDRIVDLTVASCCR
ncbi:ABC transporter ATP-binding protein [Clostridium aminobutyricum]|uniref:ATP-binding cassette domain-containing protein n=1 Tax=Clostridium aminobutyricum TaxID=33953 RepID=A0A939D9J7_CLOAM|nr:ATP-binding cassette domain-containing protein [Clostridium aminobutyricum]MBN7773625.1 ATP-binding cassette domain-containing protein [Clostridium aminobutyricum]